jgi:hypothetical protein
VARLQDSSGPFNDLYYQPVYEPFGQWWSDAVVAVLQDGKDAGMVLNGIQYKAQATLDCMQAAGVNATTPTDRVANTAISCANKVDPSYHTLQELFKLQASP